MNLRELLGIPHCRKNFLFLLLVSFSGLDGLSASHVCFLVLVQVSGLKMSQRNGRVRTWSPRKKEKLRHLVCPERRLSSLFLNDGLLPENRADAVRARAAVVLLPVGLQVQPSSCYLRQLPQPS